MKIPYKFEPRKYQLPFLDAMDSGYTRAVLIWHRRSGKDKTCFNFMVKKALERVGIYYYLFPSYQQAKKALWEAVDKEGFKMLDHIPKALIKNINNTEMKIELFNGSLIRLVGVENVDSIVGTNPIGCIFSEYSLQNPKAWDFIRPILAENDGWAVFNFTPRGKQNHGFELYEFAKHDSRWFTSILTVEDTNVLSQEKIDEEKREMFAKYGDDSLFMQEYYCSFEVAVEGSYYSNQIQQAVDENRITIVPYEQSCVVDTWWDLGYGDSMAIWFTQTIGNQIRIIDYYENNSEGFPFYANILNQKHYTYGVHHAPHDIAVHELGSGKSRLEVAQSLGIYFQTVTNISVDDGINAVRMIFNKCWFDEEKTRVGLNALRSYHKEYSEKNKEYKSTPLHDWSSHASDAFRYFAVGHRKVDISPMSVDYRRSKDQY